MPLLSSPVLIAPPLQYYSHRLSSPIPIYSSPILIASSVPIASPLLFSSPFLSNTILIASPLLFSSPLRSYSILIASPLLSSPNLFSSPLLSYSHLLLSYSHTVIIITIINPLHSFLHYQSTHCEANDGCKHDIFQEREGVLILKFCSNF